MTFLAILLIIIALTLYGLKEYYQIKLDVTPQHTPEASLAYIAQLIEQSAATGTFLDLSSGYGSRVLQLAKRLPTWEITGVERSPTPWIIANLRTLGKNYGNYRFFLNDPVIWPLRDYSVVFLHQREKVVKRWEASIAKRLAPGTLFICYNHALPRVKPIDTIAISPQVTIYLYKKPVPAEQEPILPIEPVSVIQTPPPAPVIEDHPEAQPSLSIPS